MEVVKDTTQHLRANISQERLGKARLDFGNAGEVLGETAYFVYNQNRQEQQVQSVPQFQFDTALPELQQAPKVDARKDQRDLEDLVRAKNNGAITDAQFQKSVTDIQDRMYYSGNFTPNEIKSLLNEVPGYSAMAKEINTGYFTAERQGANEAIKEDRKAETAKDIEIAQTVVGVDTNLPMEKQAEIGHRYRMDQEFIKLSDAQIKELSRGDPNLEVAYQRSQNVSLVSVLNATANSIYRAGISSGASKQEIYRAIHEGVFATVQQYGKNPMVVQELIDAVLDPYKKYSEGDLTAQKQINEGLEAEKQGRTSRQYIIADNLSRGALTTANNMRALGFDLNLMGLDSMKEMSQYLQTASDIGQFPDSMSNEGVQQMLLSYARNGDKVTDENVDLAVVRKTTDETGKQTSIANTETIAKSGNEYLNVANKVLLKELAEKGKVRPEVRETVKQTLANVLQAKVAAYRSRLTKDFSLGVDASGNIIVLKAGQADSPTVVGRWFETDAAEAESLAKELREVVSLVPALRLSRQELQGILPEIKGAAPTTGEAVEALGNSAVLPALDTVNTELQSVGKQIGKTAAGGVKDVLEGVSEAGNYIADMFESFLNMLGRDRLSPEEREAVEGLSQRLFQLDEVKEYTATSVIGGDEIMSAALEAEPDEIDSKIDYSKRPPIVDDDTLYDKMDGKYKGTLAKKGDIPKGTSLLTGKNDRTKPISSGQVKKQKKLLTDRVESIKTALDEGRDTMQIQLLYDGKPQTVTIPTALALTAIGEGFSSTLTKDNTIGFGTKKFVAKPILERMGIELTEKTVLDPETAAKVAMVYIVGVPSVEGDSEKFKSLNGAVDKKLRKVFGKDFDKGKDPVRIMLARDLLFGFGPSSVNFTDYKKVGLDKYLIRVMNDATIAKDILPYVPTFPPFKGQLNGKPYEFPSPFGASRIALMELLIDDVMPSDKG